MHNNRHSRSCGFYISGTQFPAYLHGGLDYTDIAFGCTNTTHVDANGDADGVTVFLAKNCTTGERLPYDQQDAKYGGLNNNMPILAVSQLTDPTSVLSDVNTTSILANPPEGDVVPDLVNVDTCNRGCLCGYSPNKNQTLPYQSQIDSAYLFCQCNVWLQHYLSAAVDEQPNKSAVLVTAANITLFDHYSVSYTGFVTTASSTGVKPLQSPFECLGKPLEPMFMVKSGDEETYGPLFGGGR